jgi:hypothetical protein
MWLCADCTSVSPLRVTFCRVPDRVDAAEDTFCSGTAARLSLLRLLASRWMLNAGCQEGAREAQSPWGFPSDAMVALRPGRASIKKK